MFRWLFHIFAALSLLLMIASCVAWARSYSNCERLIRQEGAVVLAAGYAGGDFILSEFEFQIANVPLRWAVWSGDRSTDDTDYFRGESTASVELGVFEYCSLRPADSHRIYNHFTLIIIPMWLVTLLLALPPMWWLLAYRKRTKAYRLQRNLCVTCGYDLRSSPGACPECGAGDSTDT